MNYIKEVAIDNFIVRLAKNKHEIEMAQELRYKDLLLEFNENRRDIHIDRCDEDKYCDHLIVIDTTVDEVVGTYRLLTKEQTSKYNIQFFSECEFDITKLKQRNNILELGRAVVKAEYRNTIVFKMLWTGLIEYIKQFDIQYLFGTASYHGTDPTLYYNSFAYYYANNYIGNDMDCFALAPNVDIAALPTPIDNKLARAETPALIRAYIAIGAQVCSQAYIDEWFNGVDIMVVININNLNKPILKRMFGIEF